VSFGRPSGGTIKKEGIEKPALGQAVQETGPWYNARIREKWEGRKFGEKGKCLEKNPEVRFLSVPRAGGGRKDTLEGGGVVALVKRESIRKLRTFSLRNRGIPRQETG